MRHGATAPPTDLGLVSRSGANGKAGCPVPPEPSHGPGGPRPEAAREVGNYRREEADHQYLPATFFDPNNDEALRKRNKRPSDNAAGPPAQALRRAFREDAPAGANRSSVHW